LPAGHPVRVLLTREGGHLGYIARGRRHTCRHWLDDLISGGLEACRVRVDQG
jgi:predicted alpha/beta-fold hydrolase